MESGTNHSFATVEFDDQGMFWNRAQLANVLEEIRRIPDTNNVILICYVHGWKHDASERSGNRASFRTFVESFSAALNPPGDPPTNHVAGVYLGWRGDLIRHDRFPFAQTDEPFQTLGYWNRRNAARRVSGISMSEAILSLVGRVREKPSNRAVVVGHSMGGLIVERAVTQVMVGSRLINSAAIKKLSTQGDVGAAEAEVRKARTALSKVEAEVEGATKAINNLENRIRATNSIIESLESEVVRDSKAWSTAIQEAAKGWTRLRDRSPTRQLVGTNLDVVIETSDFAGQSEVNREFYERLGSVRTNLAAARLTVLLGAAAAGDKDLQDRLERFLQQVTLARRAAASFWTNDSRMTVARRNANLLAEESRKLTAGRGGLDPKLQEARGGLQKAEADFKRVFSVIAPILAHFERPPADLVLLVNPASEALIARKTIDAFQQNPLLREMAELSAGVDITGYDQPWVISVTTRGDSATGTIFPLAESITAVGLQFRPETNYSRLPRDGVEHKGLAPVPMSTTGELSLVIRTAPHHEQLVSHEAIKTGPHPPLTNFAMLVSSNMHHDKRFEVVGVKDTFVLTNREPSRLSSYWVLQVPEELLPDHNNFFQSNFYALATSLYRMAVDQRRETNATSSVQPPRPARRKLSVTREK